MKNVQKLHRNGALTDQQMLVAYRFTRDPRAFNVAPSLYRVLNDLVIKSRPLQEVEQERGWAARSAKVVLGLVLNALLEIGGTSVQEDDGVTTKEALEYISGTDPAAVCDVMRDYELTLLEARLFLVLQNAEGRAVSVDRLMAALYFDRDPPQEKIISVIVCRVRAKIAARNLKIENYAGGGYRLVAEDPRSAVNRLGDDLRAYVMHVETGLSLPHSARRMGWANGADVLRAIIRVENARKSKRVAEEIENALRAEFGKLKLSG